MEKNENKISVTISIFSGRTNPVIDLNEDSEKQLAELIKSSIGKENIHPLPSAKLGEFYGFWVDVPEKKIKELQLPEKVHVVKGVLTSISDGKQSYWSDVAGVEQFLIKLAFKEGHGELMEKVNVNKPE